MMSCNQSGMQKDNDMKPSFLCMEDSEESFVRKYPVDKNRSKKNLSNECNLLRQEIKKLPYNSQPKNYSSANVDNKKSKVIDYNPTWPDEKQKKEVAEQPDQVSKSKVSSEQITFPTKSIDKLKRMTDRAMEDFFLESSVQSTSQELRFVDQNGNKVKLKLMLRKTQKSINKKIPETEPDEGEESFLPISSLFEPIPNSFQIGESQDLAEIMNKLFHKPQGEEDNLAKNPIPTIGTKDKISSVFIPNQKL